MLSADGRRKAFSTVNVCFGTLKHLPPMRETRVRALGQEDPLEKEIVTHSRTLAWRIRWTEKPSRLQSTELEGVGHD